eukprot:3662231-Amphidinium_carterae.1
MTHGNHEQVVQVSKPGAVGVESSIVPSVTRGSRSHLAHRCVQVLWKRPGLCESAQHWNFEAAIVASTDTTDGLGRNLCKVTRLHSTSYVQDIKSSTTKTVTKYWSNGGDEAGVIGVWLSLNVRVMLMLLFVELCNIPTL